MIARGKGKIVNIGAGVLDERVDLGCAAYCASKAALINFSRQLAAEVRRHGIVVHVVDPGGLDTGMSAEIKTSEANSDDFAMAQVVDPALRLRQPEEIMPLILFVLSDDANMLTGRFFQVSSKDSPRYLQL
jgi:NAD(P)-dependent dehydrogenase (short-subunit alcohol dehydrogenase family)